MRVINFSAAFFGTFISFSYLCSRKGDLVNGNQVRNLSCSCSCKPLFTCYNEPLTIVGKA